MTDLGTLPGGNSSQATGINDHGLVVGSSSTASGNTHAFVFENGVLLDLGTLPGGDFSEANGINDHGEMVGDSSATGQLSHSTLWKPAS